MIKKSEIDYLRGSMYGWDWAISRGLQPKVKKEELLLLEKLINFAEGLQGESIPCDTNCFHKRINEIIRNN